jgi:hypothetical protein
MKIEGVDQRLSLLARFAFDAARHRLQKLAGVLEIALPEERRAFACEAIGGIGCGAVISDDDTPGRRHRRFGAPARGARAVGLGPGDGQGFGEVRRRELGH